MSKFNTTTCEGYKIVSEVIPYTALNGANWRAEVKTRGLNEDMNILIAGPTRYNSEGTARADAAVLVPALKEAVDQGLFRELLDTVMLDLSGTYTKITKTGVTALGWNIYEFI